MEKEYIERDEAIRKAIDACIKVVGHGITQFDAVDIAEMMESISSADVVEVRHGSGYPIVKPSLTSGSEKAIRYKRDGCVRCAETAKAHIVLTAPTAAQRWTVKEMTKCDFCVYSNPKKDCWFSLVSCRKPHCEEAIEKMTKALQGMCKDRKKE